MNGRIALLAMALSLTALPAKAEPFHHPFGELREYHRHWLSVCPNQFDPTSEFDYYNSCWASAWTGNADGSFTGDFPGDRLSVLRNRTSGQMKITLVSVMASTVDQTRPIEVRHSSGRIRDYTYSSDFTTNQNSLNEYTFTNPAHTEDIIERMKRGSHVVVTIPTQDGGHRMQFSTLGLRAAIHFLERYADRTGPSPQ